MLFSKMLPWKKGFLLRQRTLSEPATNSTRAQIYLSDGIRFLGRFLRFLGMRAEFLDAADIDSICPTQLNPSFCYVFFICSRDLLHLLLAHAIQFLCQKILSRKRIFLCSNDCNLAADVVLNSCNNDRCALRCAGARISPRQYVPCLL